MKSIYLETSHTKFEELSLESFIGERKNLEAKVNPIVNLEDGLREIKM